MEILLSIVIYLLSYGISYLSSSISVASKKRIKRVTFGCLAIVIVTIVATFRTSGIDFFAYKDIFNSIKGGAAYPIEYGWYFLNYISKTYKMLLFISSAIFYIFAYLALKSLSNKEFSFAWFIYILLFSGVFYNAMRQMIAVSIGIYAFSRLKQRNLIKYLFYVVLAALFHKTAIILIVIPIYLKGTQKVKHQLLFSIIISIAFVVMIPVIEAVLSKLNFYSGYFERAETNIKLSFLLYVIPPIMFYYVGNYPFIKKNKEINTSLSLYLLTIPFQVVGVFLTYADRLMLYFQPMICVFAALLLSEYKQNLMVSYKTTKWLYVIWFLFHYFILFVLLNGNGIFPYNVAWQL